MPPSNEFVVEQLYGLSIMELIAQADIIREVYAAPDPWLAAGEMKSRLADKPMGLFEEVLWRTCDSIQQHTIACVETCEFVVNPDRQDYILCRHAATTFCENKDCRMDLCSSHARTFGCAPFCPNCYREVQADMLPLIHENRGDN